MNRRDRLERPTSGSLGVAAPVLRRVWVAMQVEDGQDRNQVVCRREEHAVREIANEGAPGAFFDGRKLKRVVAGVS